MLTTKSRRILTGLGREAVEEGRFSVAHKIADILAELAPDRPQSLEVEALIAAAQGRLALAESLFIECLARFEQSGTALEWLLKQAIERRDWGRAAELALNHPIDKTCFGAAIRAADKLAGSEEVGKALDVLEAVIAAGCTETDVFIRASRLALLTNDLDRNAAILARLRELRPKSPYGHLETYHRLNYEMKFDAAALELRRLSKTHPDDGLIQSLLCENAIQRHDATEAAACLERLRGHIAGHRIQDFELRLAAMTSDWQRVLDLTEKNEFTKLDRRKQILVVYAHIFQNHLDTAGQLIDMATSDHENMPRDWFAVARQVEQFRRKRGTLPTEPGYRFAPSRKASRSQRVDPVVRTLWVGGNLSPIEQLCLSSWVSNGFDLELYTYGDVGGVPAGCELRDAREILPENAVFMHSSRAGRSKGSYAGFADIFRWHMLEMKGGFWTDCDLLCLKPFELPGTLAVASELARTFSADHPAITNCFYGGPAGHELFREGAARARSFDAESLKWGEAGTQLLGQLVMEKDLEEFVMPHTAFNPVGPYRMIETLLAPENGEIERLRENSFGLHLYNEVWRSHNISKQGPFPRDSLLHHLCAEYGVAIDVEPKIDLMAQSRPLLVA